ncbi:MAG: CHAT domain-containing protein [Pseudonocardiaceae bacterium]
MTQHPKVFLSYRSTDRAVVEQFAERLRQDGVDAWYDHWEIAPGDDIVAKMDQGIDGCAAGLIFVSRTWFDGSWVQDEYTSLVLRKVEDGIRLIPVLLEDVGNRLPARLRKLARRSVTDYEAIRDTLLGIDRRPGVTTALQAHTRAVTLRLEDTGAGRATVSLLIDGQVKEREAEVRVPGSLHLGGLGPAAFAGLRQQVGSVLLPGAVGRASEQLLAELDAITVVDVHVEASPALASLPFEAAVTPQGRTPVLLPGVRMRRGVLDQRPDQVPPAPGPLKILVAVGAPDENKTKQARLDIEKEMGSILDAVAPAVRDERAQVRILEVANKDTIAAALTEDDYHVLHLSGHGNKTGIVLEDEDGAPVPTSAADLADALRNTGRVVPLVFLSSCHGADDAEGLALTLHQLGLPRVIAMQASVTDEYATELAAAFYRQLSVPAFPRVGVALARARQALAATQGAGEAAERPSTEWATATLTATDDGPLIDGDLDLVPLRRSPVHLATGPVPALDVGELIGRRVELRQTLRALRDDRRSVVLTGIGGVGKSSVAGRVMARLAEQGWVCSVTTGTWSLDNLCATLLADLLAAKQKHRWTRDLHDQLAALPADDRARLRFLDGVLRQHPVLLVLDNFEDNLTADGVAFTDPGTSTVIERLAESANTGRLLMTCRYPLPDMQDLLRHLSVGPLSPSETRRLFLRLPGLRTLTSEDAALVNRLVGGHPRVLEFLDALRRCGASTDQVRRRFRKLADDHQVKVTQTRELPEDVAVAVQLGARDICLDVLLSTLDDAEREVLLQTAVSNLPVEVPDLTVALAGSGLDDTAIKFAAQRLADLSLAVHADDGLWVHRWTAEGLREHQPLDSYRNRCLRAGELRLRRIASSRRDVEEGIEATQNFLDAQDWNHATEIATGVADFLAQDSNLRRLSFAAQVLSVLPPLHQRYHLFIDHEGASLVALGFTDEAVKRYRHLVDAFTQRARAEPGRADYQRDLSVSYNKLADLNAALGQGEQALTLYQQSLDIAERLARAEPGRADYQRDLSVSYNKLGVCFAQLGRAEDAAAALERHLQLALDVYQRLPGQVNAVVDLAFALHLTADLDDHGDERNQQSRELLEVLEADQRLPRHGKALLDSLRRDQAPSVRPET